jgi:toxin ParE1/3/4
LPSCAGKPDSNRVVAKYKLTRLSLADLESILEYTLSAWSEKQAERYLSDLQACFQELADRPGLGRTCEAIWPGLMRIEHGSQIVFCRRKEYGIRVIRVPHQSMLPDKHLLDEKE